MDLNLIVMTVIKKKFIKMNNQEHKYIIGIDEVGRGPIAGPVAVCSFIANEKNLVGIIEKARKEYSLPIRDSKKLTKKMREKWFEYLKKQKEEGICNFKVSFVSPENIDKFGIAKCIQKALGESIKKVTSQKELPASFYIFLDGGLHAPAEYINQETIIKGDELHPVISLASIVAKVSPDSVMTKYGDEYPEYGFEKHSGYGTKSHYEAIKKHGQTPIHRKSFIHN